MGGEAVKEAWKNFWVQHRDKEWPLDEMSRTILAELLKNCGEMKGKKVLEAGCGSGVISAEVAASGADAYLIDISKEALAVAKTSFSSRNVCGTFVQGDILDLPFGEATFDIVWNAGVMEHFEGKLQESAIESIARTLKTGGLFVTFNPYEKALFYRIGKRAAERKGTWPYGPEIPVKSLKERCAECGLSVSREYPICFNENLLFISYVSKHLKSILKLILKPFSRPFLIRTFGGYLLVTIAVKQAQ
jgi:SAM-dependent methyltransferase